MSGAPIQSLLYVLITLIVFCISIGIKREQVHNAELTTLVSAAFELLVDGFLFRKYSLEEEQFPVETKSEKSFHR